MADLNRPTSQGDSLTAREHDLDLREQHLRSRFQEAKVLKWRLSGLLQDIPARERDLEAREAALQERLAGELSLLDKVAVREGLVHTREVIADARQRDQDIRERTISQLYARTVSRMRDMEHAWGYSGVGGEEGAADYEDGGSSEGSR